MVAAPPGPRHRARVGLASLAALLALLVAAGPVSAATEADLSVTNAVDNVQLVPRQPFTFTLTVTNTSAEVTSRDVKLVESLPLDEFWLEIVSVAGSAGTCETVSGSFGPYTTRDVTCSVGDIAPGASATLTLTLRGNQPVDAQVAGSARSATPDPNTTNSSAFAVAHVVNDAARTPVVKISVPVVRGVAAVPVTCPAVALAACSGSLELKVRVVVTNRMLRLGPVPYTVAPGRTVKPRVKVSKAVRKMLAKKGSVVAAGRVSSKNAFGWSAVAQAVVILKRTGT
jgi:hypothetical protein